MIAKLIVWGPTREAAMARMRRALREYVISGITTNIPFHLALLDEPDFVAGRLSTHFIPEHPQLLERTAEWVERKRGLRPRAARRRPDRGHRRGGRGHALAVLGVGSGGRRHGARAWAERLVDVVRPRPGERILDCSADGGVLPAG